jgi:hypothetical protein
MPAGSTYTPIATTTLASAAASFTFSSIPSTYTDLVLIATGGTVASGQAIFAQYNGDTTNYSDTVLVGNGSAASSTRASVNGVRIIGRFLGTDGTLNANGILHIMNYSNTTTFKTSINRANNSYGTSASVTLWRATPAAINSIALIGDGPSNLLAGTTFTLYGIASA